MLYYARSCAVALALLPLAAQTQAPTFRASPVCENGQFVGVRIQTDGAGVFGLRFPPYNPCTVVEPQEPKQPT